MTLRLTGGTYRDLTDANGQTVRIFMPRSWNGAVVVWNHHQSGTPAASFGPFPTGAGFPYASCRTLQAAGYAVLAPTNHTDSWTAATGQGDGPAALTLWEGIAGSAATRVVEVGQSMGGSMALERWKLDLYGSRLKGVYLIDGVCSLEDMYENRGFGTSIESAAAFSISIGTLTAATAVGDTNILTAASFPTVGTKIKVGTGTANVETVTTTSASNGTTVGVTAMTKTHASGVKVSDYPTKTAGRDPALWTAPDVARTGTRFLSNGGAADTTVPPAVHGQAMKTLLDNIAAPAETAYVAHAFNHLTAWSYRPRQLLAFANRCT